SDSPVFRMRPALSSAISQSTWTPVASTTRRAAWATSGPMPSPGIKVTGYDIHLLYGLTHYRQIFTDGRGRPRWLADTELFEFICENEPVPFVNYPLRYLLKKSMVRCQASLAAASS